MLYSVLEKLTNGYNSESLLLFSLVSIAFGVYIIVTRNPVVSVLFLIGLFVTIALYLMTINLVFIGLAYLLVYVGAVSILFLFILMLINVRTSELVTEGKNSLVLAIIVVICFNFTFNAKVPHSIYFFDFIPKNIDLLKDVQHTIELIISYPVNILAVMFKGLNSISHEIVKLITETGNVHSSSWETSLVEINHITSIGNLLYGEFFMFLILTGFVLLLAMVGTIVTTVKRKLNNNYTLALSTFELYLYSSELQAAREFVLNYIENSGILEFDPSNYTIQLGLQDQSLYSMDNSVDPGNSSSLMSLDEWEASSKKK